MSVVKELLRAEENGKISFGNYELRDKKKLEDFAHMGDVYKVKTFAEITKLEKNGMFVYESVPGTAVLNMEVSEQGMAFLVEGNEDAQITLGLEDEAEYQVTVADMNVGQMKSNLSGKLSLSVELNEGTPVSVKVEKIG